MFKPWKLVCYIIIGFLIGMVFIEPGVPVEPNLYIEYGINKNAVYSTIAGNLLSTNVRMLELCLYLKNELPKVADSVIDDLQAGAIVLKTLDGGRFKLIDIKKVNVPSEVVLVKINGVESTAKFWVTLTSIVPVIK